MAEVFIDGFLDKSDNNVHCTVPSAIVIFIQNYCGPKSVEKLFFVQPDSQEKCCVNLPYAASNLPAHDFVEKQSIEERIKACVLPAAILDKQFLITAGLCSVLRHIVKRASIQYPDRGYITILGHKEMCLKSCAEVSAWTKFCEVEIISSTEQILLPSGKAQKFHDRQEIAQDLPTDFLKFESHLKEAPIIHNIGKKRRELLKRNVAEQSKQEQCIAMETSKNPEDLSNTFLSHTYSEGIEFTLTDLVLYYCVSLVLREHNNFSDLLERKVPNVFQWYLRVSKRSDIRGMEANNGNLLSRFGISSDNCEDTNQSHLNDISKGDIPASISVNQKRHGKKKYKASSNEILTTLEQIKKLQLGKPLTSHPMGDSVKLPWDSFPSHVHPSDGDLPKSRVSRKCEQLENLATAVQHIAKPGDVIVDFCSGGGHLGIVVAHLLPDCHVILVENKEESIRRAASRVDKLALNNMTIYQCNLDYYQGKFDIGICLHACGVATDLVLQRCLDIRSSFVICPCCYGNIKNTHTMSYPRSNMFSHRCISYEQYLVLGHGADQTETSIPTAPIGQQCMVCVDSDRATLAEEHGYKVDICTLIPATCSPKNNLIIGVCPRS